MFIRPNHQFTQPCTSQSNGCQTHSVSAAKSLSVRLAQLSQISRPPSTRVFCHTAFPLGFLRCKQTEMFSICGCFSLIRAAERGKERTCDKTRRKDETMHEFCLQSSLDPNPHLCLSQFANCNCLPVIIRKISLYSPAGKVLSAHLQGFKKDPALTLRDPEWTSDVRKWTDRSRNPSLAKKQPPSRQHKLVSAGTNRSHESKFISRCRISKHGLPSVASALEVTRSRCRTSCTRCPADKSQALRSEEQSPHQMTPWWTACWLMTNRLLIYRSLTSCSCLSHPPRTNSLQSRPVPIVLSFERSSFVCLLVMCFSQTLHMKYNARFTLLKVLYRSKLSPAMFSSDNLGL